MQILKSQSWELIEEDEEDEKISIEFSKFKDDVDMSIIQNKCVIQFNKKQIEELKNILESTKYIFNQ